MTTPISPQSTKPEESPDLPPQAISLRDILDLLGLIPILLLMFVTNDIAFYAAYFLLTAIVISILVWIWRRLSIRRRIASITLTLLILALVFGFHNLIMWPQAEINILSSPKASTCFLGHSIISAPENFEITDNLINNQDELFNPKNDYKISKAGLSLEIVPDYTADRQYGKVVLRISGKGSTIDKLLWDDFKKGVPSQDVDLSLSDIISASGIQLNSDSLESSLMTDDSRFQQASITLKIVPSKAPNQVFGCPMVINIQNTPWLQQAKIARRDNHAYVDYFIKNLGKESDFGYRVNLTFMDGVVSDTWNPTWSGTVETQAGLSSDLFHLKKGESFSKAIPIPENLGRGRYVIQIYTYKDLGSIRITDPTALADYGNAWLFGNEGDQMIYIVCNDSGKNCPDSATYPIEQGNPIAYAFNGNDQLKNGYTYLLLNSYPANDHIVTGYNLDYWIDPNSPGYAGLSLDFNDQPVDASHYRFIRMTIQFKDDKSPINFYMYSGTDRSQFDSVRLGDGIYGKPTTNEQTLEIPLTAFQKIDQQQITRLTFSADQTMVPDNNHHEFQVRQIEFFGTK